MTPEMKQIHEIAKRFTSAFDEQALDRLELVSYTQSEDLMWSDMEVLDSEVFASGAGYNMLLCHADTARRLNGYTSPSSAPAMSALGEQAEPPNDGPVEFAGIRFHGRPVVRVIGMPRHVVVFVNSDSDQITGLLQWDE